MRLILYICDAARKSTPIVLGSAIPCFLDLSQCVVVLLFKQTSELQTHSSLSLVYLYNSLANFSTQQQRILYRQILFSLSQTIYLNLSFGYEISLTFDS
jgi:hypothetical protein